MKRGIFIKKLEHVALILDGNGRWAKQQNKPRTYGHKIGMRNIFPTISLLKKYNVKYASLFCFSTENWNRSVQEVNYLMKFPSEIFSKKEQEKYIKEGIKVVWIGRRTKVPNSTKKSLEAMEVATKDCNEITFFICLDYGAFEEIETGFKNLYNQIQNQEIDFEQITIKDILNNLYTKDTPLIDLLIRTGGEQRLSNFMLLQLSYAELYFTKTYWPDFKENDLKQAIDVYNSRDRRFGGINDEKK